MNENAPRLGASDRADVDGDRHAQYTTDAATNYTGLGWRVFPLRRCSKLPAIKRWPERATADPEHAAAFWRRHPDRGIGIATGRESGLLVLDVDGNPRDLLPGRALPPTPTQRTGGGGWQFLYQWAPALDPLPTTLHGLVDHVDLRGAGGYIVAPPSLHPNGTPYEWSLAPWDTPLAEPPEWLIEALHQRHKGRADPADWRAIARDGAAEPGRNDTLARLAGHCFRRLDPIVAAELCRAWAQSRCSPPMDATEAERTIQSIAAAECRRRGQQHG